MARPRCLVSWVALLTVPLIGVLAARDGLDDDFWLPSEGTLGAAKLGPATVLLQGASQVGSTSYYSVNISTIGASNDTLEGKRLQALAEPSTLVQVFSFRDVPVGVSVSLVSEALNIGLHGIYLGIQTWMKYHPVEDEEANKLVPNMVCKLGIDVIAEELWKMVQVIRPPQYREAMDTYRLFSVWMEGFATMDPVLDLLTEFIKVGSFYYLNKAIFLILDQALVNTLPFRSQLTIHIGKLRVLFEGIGHGWQFHSDGRSDLGMQAIWNAMTRVIDDVPGQPQEVFSEFDHNIGRLSTLVISWKRTILLGKVCLKRTRVYDRVSPTDCEAGYKLKDGWCVPDPDSGEDCSGPCDGYGICEYYCGNFKACCKVGELGACEGVTGYGDVGKCVEPGEKVILASDCAGDNEINGYWLDNGLAGDRIAYVHTKENSQGLNPRMEYSGGTWEIFVEDDGERRILYRSGMNTETAPKHGWNQVDGSGPVPQILTVEQKYTGNYDCEPCEGEKEPPKKPMYPPGVKPPICPDDYRQSGLWCVEPCPPGFKDKIGYCEQECAHAWPIDGPGYCGKDCDEMQAATFDMMMISKNSMLFTYENLQEALVEAGCRPELVHETLQTFVDLGTAFSEMECPLSAAYYGDADNNSNNA